MWASGTGTAVDGDWSDGKSDVRLLRGVRWGNALGNCPLHLPYATSASSATANVLNICR